MPEIPSRPPIADKPITLVLVAVDGTSLLEEAVRPWATHLAEAKREHEIIVVVQRLEQEKALAAVKESLPQVRIVREERPGFGAALRAVLPNVQHPLLLYLPAQPEWRPEFLKPFLERIDRVDLVSGVRTGKKVPLPLRILGFVYRLVVRVLFGIVLDPLPGWLGCRGYAYQRFVRLVFGLRLSDVACPIKLFRRQIFERMPIQSDGSFVHTELLAKANFISFLADEAPLPVPATPTSWFQDFRRVFFRPDFGPPPAHEAPQK